MNLARCTALLCFLAAGQAHGQATDLFFSEYIEGSGSNKALEIYNGTGAAVDLAAGTYQVLRYNNGATSPNSTINLTGTVTDGDVFVLVDTSADAPFLAEGDQTGALSYNGDDAMVLMSNGVVIDVVGQVGFDPGAEWFNNGVGTANQTLRRNASVCAGDSDDSDAFDPSLEWASFAIDSSDDLGSHTANCGGAPGQPQLLMTEVVITPTAGEYIEIFNPNSVAVSLSDVYLTDATFAGGPAFYYNIVTGANAGGGGFGDFLARFPDGAMINPGEYQTVALAGSTAYNGEYGMDPTYELFEDDGAADAIPDMREGLPGSINGQGGLTNGGEVAILFAWDGASDLVTDLDYVVWGDAAEAVDKTGVAIDGPDADTDTSTYLDDTAIALQEVVSASGHAAGESYQRDDLLEGSETIMGGNGANGHDETSEDLGTTWCTDAVTPGAMSNCAPVAASGVIINEFHADPAGDITGDANGDGTRNATEDEFVEIVNNTGATLDVSGWTLSDGVEVRHTFPAGTLIADQCAVVVFGGGTPTGVFGGAVVQTASEGSLSLNNGGDTISLSDGMAIQANISFGGEAGNNQSRTLDPDITGAGFVDHSMATGAAGALFSPGTQIDGSNLPGCFVAPPIVINEFQADPDTTNGDANGDGAADFADDEFIEIVNNSGAPLDVSGWTLSDATGVRHTFPAGSVIADQCSAVVFGGGTPTGVFGGAVVQTASTGSLGLSNSGDSIILNDGSTDRAMVAYGSEAGNNQSRTLDPDISGIGFIDHSMATGAAGALFSPGTLINGNTFSGCTLPPPVLVCGNPATAINAVQGNGAASPLLGSNVEIEGIVIADFQGPGGLNGFFMQEEDTDADADPTTSEGIFVFDQALGVDVNVGDRVRVAGEVAEFFDETQISNVPAVAICNTGVLNEVTRTDVNLPVADLAELEANEGMWVRFPQALTISDVFNAVRFGEFVASNGRLYQPTQVVLPGAPAMAQMEANNRNRVIIDDGRVGANQMPFLPGQDDVNPLNALNPIRNGFTVSNSEGALGFAFGSYRVQSTTSPVFDEVANPRTAAPASAAGSLQVASFNVLNYFTTLAQAGNTCGPNNLSCRGANTASELVRQTDKLVQALLALNADVIGLVEVENNATESLQAIVDAMNATAGAGAWDYLNTGTVGTDAVKPAFIFRTAATQPVGGFAILDETVDPRFDTSRQRPSVAQTFTDTNNGLITLVVSHLRAKGSCPNDNSPNDDSGDGQACWNLWRTLSMEAMVDWVNTDPTGQGDSDFLLIGDFNSYGQEDPMRVLYDAGYINLDIAANGGNPEVYSFNIFGLAGSLDHAVANADANAQVTGSDVWHINADENRSFDYNEEDLPGSGGVNLPKPANFYNVDPYRTSDHDPIVVSLDLNADVSTAFNVATSNVAESAPTTTVMLSLAGNASFDAQVRVESTGGSAIAGTDYVAVDELVTFTAGNSTAMVTITLMNDTLVEGNETIELTLTTPQGTVIGGTSLHTITISDDDTPGAVVNPTAGLVVNESGSSDTFDVILTSAPAAQVDIPVASTNTAEGTVSTSMLQFDVANWNVPQTVTVTGEPDGVVDGDQVFMINVGPAQSTDNAWDGLVLDSVSVTNLDLDTAVTIVNGNTATGTGAASLNLDGGGASCTFDAANTSFDTLASVGAQPPLGLQFPHGVVRLRAENCAPGSTVTFTLTIPQPLGLNGELWKYGPQTSTAGDSPVNVWFQFPANIAGDTITFDITDGGLGDADGVVNGVIVDPVGPVINGNLNPVAIPTLNRWGLLLMALSVLLLGAAVQQRRSRA